MSVEITIRNWKETSHKNGEMARAFEALGIAATVEVNEHGNVQAMVLAAKGHMLRVNASYGCQVQRLAPEVKSVHVLSGTVAGLPVNEQFDSYDLAYDRKSKLERAQDEGERLDIKATEVEVAHADIAL